MPNLYAKISFCQNRKKLFSGLKISKIQTIWEDIIRFFRTIFGKNKNPYNPYILATLDIDSTIE